MTFKFGARLAQVSALALALVVVTPAIGPAIGAGAAKCTSNHLDTLRRLVPEGLAIFQKLRDKSNFTVWFKCEDPQLDLTTAVHEGTHILTNQIQAYPLIKGGTTALVGEHKKLFRPGVLAPRFPSSSAYVSNYLMPGQASSADEFGYLLNELNAYSHDLNAALKLRHLAQQDFNVMHRDGLAALMSFTAAYVERARTTDGEAWTILQTPQVRHSVATLWAQAEHVMGASCGIPDYAEEAPAYLKPICAANIRHGLGRLLGRPPLCPVSCLKTAAAAPR